MQFLSGHAQLECSCRDHSLACHLGQIVPASLIIPLVSFLHQIKQKLLVFTCVACSDLFPLFFLSYSPVTYQLILSVCRYLCSIFKHLCFLFVLSLSFPQKHPIKLLSKLPPDPLSNSSLTFSLAGLSAAYLSIVKHLECWDHNFPCWPGFSTIRASVWQYKQK